MLPTGDGGGKKKRKGIFFELGQDQDESECGGAEAILEGAPVFIASRLLPL